MISCDAGSAVAAEIEVIGGTGFYSFIEDGLEHDVWTPFGQPSAPITVGGDRRSSGGVPLAARRGAPVRSARDQLPGQPLWACAPWEPSALPAAVAEPIRCPTLADAGVPLRSPRTAGTSNEDFAAATPDIDRRLRTHLREFERPRGRVAKLAAGDSLGPSLGKRSLP
ncbi:hypothetical protein GCM10009788_25840 [Nocardioides humi]|uniref:Uncharacterized protein n=1 Tax=Nocardioides humi TaxID=449461 RepID=A0ABN2AJN0_9ACTN